MSRQLPSPMAYALLLTLLAFVGSVLVMEGPFRGLLDAWAGNKGFWSFLSFSMQMTLILVTGTVVAESSAVQRLLGVLASLPRTGRQATVMVALIAMSVALIHWGLGLLTGAVLTREIGRNFLETKRPIHYPTLAAAGYSGLLVWHGGLSGSAPLKVTQAKDVAEVLGEELAARVGTLPLSSTVFSTRNLLVTGALVVVIPLVLAWLCPAPADCEPPGEMAPRAPRASAGGSFLDTTPLLVVPIVLLIGAWSLSWAAAGGYATLSPNSLNLLFFGLGLALAGSPARYMELARSGVASATGIIVQFPLYAGISGLLVTSGLGVRLAGIGASALVPSTFLAAGLLNLFVPSGGGQWGIQAPVAMAEAVNQGIDPARIVLAVAWGDQWTNAFQPFWALPLLGITGVSASDLLKNTAVVGVVVGLILLAGVLL